MERITVKRKSSESVNKIPPIIIPNKKHRKDTNQPKRFFKDNGTDDDLNNGLLLILDDLFSGKNNLAKNNKQEQQEQPEECPNPLCNHKTLEEDPEEIKCEISEIKDIMGLIDLGKKYHCKKNTHLKSLDLKILCKLVNPLTELKNMVGLKEVKENMVNQILFFLQGLNIKYEMDGFGKITANTDMLHTVITGPPGVGKTELGKILGKVYKAMGILSKGTFKLVSRSDLIAKYLGQTAIKTQEVIDSCQGGVLFIDEAYALGHSEGRDSFSKECLDTLNQNLTEKRDFLCIIAGYKDALEKCFFSMNDGLKRRFTFRYNIEGYSADDLRKIFETKLKADKWSLEFKEFVDFQESEKSDEVKRYDGFFKKNHNNFPNYGGDVETLFLKCKIVHSKRVVFEEESSRRVLSMNDIEKGFKEFLAGRKSHAKQKLGLYD